MTRRLLGVFVAAAFALGLFSGVVGTAVAHDGTRAGDDVAPMTGGMGSMMSGDMGSMMTGGMGSMMSGDMGSMMSGDMGSTCQATDMSATPMPGPQHGLHHPAATDDDAR